MSHILQKAIFRLDQAVNKGSGEDELLDKTVGFIINISKAPFIMYDVYHNCTYWSGLLNSIDFFVRHTGLLMLENGKWLPVSFL